MEPIEIKLILQGGGAKIYAILAFLEVIQELEELPNPPIKVRSVIGTSAGAIAGTAYAAGIRMTTLCTLFKRGNEAHRLLKEFSAEKPGSWKGKLWIIKKFLKLIYYRRAVWDQENLKNFLEDQFHSIGVKHFSDIKKKEVYVVATSLTQRKPKIFKKDDPVVRALLDSTAIPIFFRTWLHPNDSTSELIVDGGIAENFPANSFPVHPNNVLHPIGISFEAPSGTTPTSAAAFFLALLDAAMSVSTEHSLKLIGEENIFRLEPKISTFEFTKLLESDGPFGTEYELIKTKARAWMKIFVQAKHDQKTTWEVNPWSEANVTASNLMRELYQIYDDHEKKITFNYHRSIYKVQAFSLAAPYQTRDDCFEFTLEFSAGEQSIQMFLVALVGSREWKMDRNDSSIQVLNQNLVELQIRVLPCVDPSYADDRSLLVFLPEPIKPNSGKHILRYREESQTFFPKLFDTNANLITGTDEMVFHPVRAAGPVEKTEFIFEYPLALKGKLLLKAKPGDPRGRAMSDEEVNAHALHHHPKSRIIGWTETSAVGRWGVDIVMT